MNKSRIILVGLCLCIIGLYMLNGPQQVPEQAPNVSFKIIDGQEIKMQELQGQTVLINFWASSCAVCIDKMPELVKLYNDHQSQGLQILGVAMAYDPPNRVLATATQQRLSYPIALDIDGSISRAFGKVEATPTSFLISKNGQIIEKIIGDISTNDLEKKIEYLQNINTKKQRQL